MERALSEVLKLWRAERPDEWIMDEFIREAERMEKQLQNTLSNSDYAKCPCCGEPWNIRRNRACKCGAVIQCKHFA